MRRCTRSIVSLGSGLRWQLVTEPSLIGAVTLTPVAPPVPRLNVKDAVPCVAAGRDASGAAIVVVCSTGVDLDLIPFAADARRRSRASVHRATCGSSSFTPRATGSR